MPNPKDDPKSPEWRPYIFARDLAAFAVTASSTRKRYANTSHMRTTKTSRRACTNTSGAQFGSERKSMILPPRPIVEPEIADLSAPKFDDNAIWSRFCELVAARVHLLTSGGPLTGSLVPIRTIE